MPLAAYDSFFAHYIFDGHMSTANSQFWQAYDSNPDNWVEIDLSEFQYVYKVIVVGRLSGDTYFHRFRGIEV